METIDIIRDLAKDLLSHTMYEVAEATSQIDVAIDDDNSGTVDFDVESSKFTKIVALAIKIAEKKGLIDKQSVYDAAAMTDEVVTRIRIAKKVTEGVMDRLEADETLIDRANARVITFVEHTFDAGMPIVVDVLSKVIASAYPTAAPYIPLIKQTIVCFLPQIKEEVITGIRKLSVWAKEKLPQLIDKGRAMLEKVAGYVEKVQTIKNRVVNLAEQ